MQGGYDELAIRTANARASIGARSPQGEEQSDPKVPTLR